jgi:hypothetical protein
MAPVQSSKFAIAGIVEGLNASGGTALYDAVRTAVEVADNAEGPPDAIRAVVILTDGRATAGMTGLSDLVNLSSRAEVDVPNCRGFEANSPCIEFGGRVISLNDVIGSSLKVPTKHPVQVFFIGIGDADINVGRILAQATGAEYQGATEKDLAEVLEAFSKYF